MKKLMISASVALFAFSTAVSAADCGEPPMDKPNLPAVTNDTTADDVRDARTAVLSYSSKVTQYLTCMDTWIAKLTPYMTKEQNTRYSDDTANLHEERIAVEEQMNEIIRAYRRIRRDSQNG